MEKSMNEREERKRPQAGILEWFRPGEYEAVEKAIADIKKLGIKNIRTGISWADWHTPEGSEWYDWMIPRIAGELELLPCFLYTPPSMGIKPKTASPPVYPKAYADFIDVMITKYGIYFEWVELWNEPNNLSEWDWRLDPDWNIFSEMVGGAAYWAKIRGKKTVLGGMSPIDTNWLEMMFSKGVMNYIDAVGIHGFPDVFDTFWEGWENYIKEIKTVLKNNNSNARIWITEAGFSTWQHDEQRQLSEYLKLTEQDADRFYWYSLKDLPAEMPTVDGFHLDEREYFFGMIKTDGTPKLLYRMLESNTDEELKQKSWLSVKSKPNVSDKFVMITGGAGFIGTNLAQYHLMLGKKVMVFDNLSRPGVENNLQWLVNKYGKDVEIRIADIRNEHEVHNAVKNAEQIFHFAAQVAVTTSISNPKEDFDINARGTLNILNAMTSVQTPPAMIFTSTNKVYGQMEEVGLEVFENRYAPMNEALKKHGINENRSIEFHSPYGCSKGTADQYVLDFARTFGIPAAVFRMSCIYGPHQYGTEDQGWVAHFVLNALKDNRLNIYGDGKQVRDILFVEDLVEAFVMAQENISSLTGQAFNIGGGTDNAVSLIEVLELISKISKKEINVKYGPWRPGDQKYYVSDTRKFELATGWTPRTSVKAGLERLYEWLKNVKDIEKATSTLKQNI
jgi:CDP-paratose 2-epimerase